MATMHVAFLLNLFQPVTQSPEVLDEISRECYQPLVELFESKMNPRFTISVSNSLFRLLEDQGKQDIIDGFRKVVDRGAVELVHTGAYHSIFPLISQQEVRRQIDLDIEFKREHFGITTRGGFIAPELCYDDKLLDLYREFGFRWTLLDDAVLSITGTQLSDRNIYYAGDLAVLTRSSLWSNRIREADRQFITGRQFVERLSAEAAGRPGDSYRIIALAGETFGHHVKYYQETFLRDMLFALQQTDKVCLHQISELLSLPTLQKTAKPEEQGKAFTYFPPCSWATQEDDHLRGDYYPHWKSQGNPIHARLWDLSNLIFGACRYIDFENGANGDLRKLLDTAFYSTQYFWASLWFWDPRPVCAGIDLQMRALYKCARLTSDPDLLQQGKRIYTQLMWEVHNRKLQEKCKENVK